MTQVPYSNVGSMLMSDTFAACVEVNAATISTTAVRVRRVEDRVALVALKSRCPHITVMDLQYQTLFVEDVAFVLELFPEIVALNLHSGSIFLHWPSRAGDNPVSESYASKIRRQILQVMPRKKYNDCAESSAHAFVTALERFGSRLKVLNLHDNKMYRSTAAYILSRLPHACPQLQGLILDDQGIYPVGYKAFAAALPDFQFLRVLSLRNTHIDAASAALLCSSFRNMGPLQVDVSSNYLSNQLIVQLDEAAASINHVSATGLSAM